MGHAIVINAGKNHSKRRNIHSIYRQSPNPFSIPSGLHHLSLHHPPQSIQINPQATHPPPRSPQIQHPTHPSPILKTLPTPHETTREATHRHARIYLDQYLSTTTDPKRSPRSHTLRGDIPRCRSSSSIRSEYMSGFASRTPFVHDEWRVNCARPCRGPSMHGAVREFLLGN